MGKNYVKRFVDSDPTMAASLVEFLDFWGPEQIPMGMSFNAIGRHLAAHASGYSDSVMSLIAKLIEEMLADDEDMQYATTTYLLESFETHMREDDSAAWPGVRDRLGHGAREAIALWDAENGDDASWWEGEIPTKR